MPRQCEAHFSLLRYIKVLCNKSDLDGNMLNGASLNPMKRVDMHAYAGDLAENGQRPRMSMEETKKRFAWR